MSYFKVCTSRVTAGLMVLSLLHGCATTPTPVPVDYYKQVNQKAAASPSLLVVSACAVRDEVGNDYVLTNDSEQRARQMANESAEYLRGQGMNLVAAPVLLMCGGYVAQSGETLEFVKSKDEKGAATVGRFPHLFEAGPSDDPAVTLQLHDLFQRAYNMQNSQIARAGETPSRFGLGASQEDLDRIRARTGADHVWLVSGKSLEISGGKVVTSAILTSVLTMGLAAAVPVGGASNMAALVDLRDASIVWKKDVGSLGGTTTASAGPGALYSTNTYRSPGIEGTGSAWAQAMFAPLLSPATATVVGQGVVSAPAADRHDEVASRSSSAAVERARTDPSDACMRPAASSTRSRSGRTC